MAWVVESYQTEGGTDVLDVFVNALDRLRRAEALALLQILELRGNQLRLPHSRALGQGLLELRGRKHGVRMFYGFMKGQRAVVVGGIVKKRDTIPARVLAQMRARLADVIRNA